MKVFWLCPQIKLSKTGFQHVTANESVLAMPANETLQNWFTACGRKSKCFGYARKLNSPKLVLSM
jgi:hypothetical protein